MYEPYPVPEIARDHQKFRYSSLWTFAKQDLKLLMFLLVIGALIGYGMGYLGSCLLIALGFFCIAATLALSRQRMDLQPSL